MTTEIPSHEEFYGNDLSSEIDEFEWLPDSDDIDEQLMLVAVLALLQTLYKEYQYKSPDYILTHLPDSVNELKKKLSTLSEDELKKVAESHRTTTLEIYGLNKIVHNQISLDYDITGTVATIKSSVQATLNQLRDDIITKAYTFKDTLKSVNDFNVRSNFRRAIRRTKNFVRFNAQLIKQKVTRSVQKFVYGPDMKYFWDPSGHNTCEWCWALARLPAQTIDRWPLDHPNGGCGLRPESIKTTEEYQKYLKTQPVTLF